MRSTARRVGIVGAGVSGLAAAHHLRRAGYRDVTILEREPRVGGKCCTVAVDGRSYELGAVFGARCYTETLRMMHDAGVRGGSFAGMHTYDLDGHRFELVPTRQRPRLLWSALVTYALLSDVRFRRLHRPGLAGVDRALAEPFEPFARRHGLPTLERALAPPFTAFGYGYFDEVPAAYVLKYVDMPMLESMALQSRRLVWPGGVQTLWERVAEGMDVRRGVPVSRVTREGGCVGVVAGGEELEFDALILTGPLDEALGYLDASPTERRLFTRIRTDDYWVLLCEVSGLPEESGFLPQHFTAEESGHVLAWYHRWAADPVYTFYVLGGRTRDATTIRSTCARDVARLGGTLHRTVAVRRWKYFPHVGPADLAAGYYDELEGLQGVRGTYYAGEVMSFATIEACARYSRALVERWFA